MSRQPKGIFTNTAYQIHKAAIRTAFAGVYGWQPYGRHAAFLEESQWWPHERLVELQNNKLQKLIAHAYACVPFYRRRMDAAGVRPENVRSSADLAALPVLTKQDIQIYGDELLAQNVDRSSLRENHTGGSTGFPLTFFQDANYIAWGDADLLRNYRMTGYELGTRWAFLWGSDYDARTHKGWQGRLKDRVIYNTLWINTFDLRKDTIRQAATALARWQPEILVAYVSSVTMLARGILEDGLPPVRPRAIQTSTEVLTPADRALLQQAFRAPAFDRYGCREVGNIGHECSAHAGLHVLMENNLLELLGADGRPVAPGSPGRVVVTNLNNFAMPLIRYENGDMASPGDGPCTCGRGLPVMQGVVGRTTDIITAPSGKLLHGEFFTHLFYKIQGVQQFRVIQETLEELHIQLAPGPGFDQQKVFSFLEDVIHTHGDPAFQVKFFLFDALPPAASGKYRFTISKVAVKLG